MQIDQYEFEVLVNGKPVAEYDHGGLTFIEGKEGTEFSIRMRNRTGKRTLFVPTIDGLSVMDGKEADFNSSGYIVGPYSTETIDGWRTNDNEVAKFFFDKVKESYAAKTGKGGNEGIIGCAVFPEKERAPEPIIIKEYIPMPYEKHCLCPHGNHGWGNNHMFQCSNGAFGATNASNQVSMLSTNTAGAQMNASASLGTGFGEVKYSPTRTIEFERVSHPTCVFNIRYDSRQRLEEMGVTFKKPLQIAIASAFPKESRYCEPPKDWQG